MIAISLDVSIKLKALIDEIKDAVPHELLPSLATLESQLNSLTIDEGLLAEISSAETSERFSNYLGKYQKMEVNNTFTTGDTYSTYGQILPGSSNTNIYGIQCVDRPRVEESEITGLSSNTLFIKKERRSEIIKAHCISGNARGTYTEPRRRLTQTRSTNRTNWVLFVFLLIFTPPIGLLYGFITSGRRGKIVFGILLLLLIALFVTGIILVTTQGY